MTRLRLAQIKIMLGEMVRQLDETAEEIDPQRKRKTDLVVRLDQAASSLRSAQSAAYLQHRSGQGVE